MKLKTKLSNEAPITLFEDENDEFRYSIECKKHIPCLMLRLEHIETSSVITEHTYFDEAFQKWMNDGMKHLREHAKQQEEE